MLIDNINRYEGSAFFKLINVEQYIAHGHKIPPQIHSVPALMFKETKRLLFGKQVFDYLLLPAKGFLLTLPKSGAAASASAPIEPASFSICAGSSSGDNYAFINEGQFDTQKGYNWCGLDEKISIETPDDTTNNMEKEEKSKKSIPDIATLRSQRDMDIQQVLPADAHAVPIIATM